MSLDTFEHNELGDKIMNTNFKLPRPIKRDLLATFAFAAAFTVATTGATVVLVSLDKNVETASLVHRDKNVEIVPTDNAADLCIRKTALDAARRRSQTAAVEIEGAEFDAIKRECTTKTGEKPAIWGDQTGMIFAPLTKSPSQGHSPFTRLPRGGEIPLLATPKP